MIDHVVDRDSVVANNTTAFAGLGNLHHVVLPAQLCLCLNESTRHIEYIRIVNKQPVVVVVIVARCPLASPRALHGDGLLAGIVERCSGSNGNVGTARAVYHNLRKDNTAPERRGNNDTLHTSAFRQSSASHHAKPQLPAGVQQLLAMPFHLPVGRETPLAFGLTRMVFRCHGKDTLIHMCGISATETVPVDTNHSQCTQSAKPVQVFEHQRICPMRGCGYSGRSSGCPAAHHNHIVAAQDRKCTRRRVDKSFLQ